MAVLLSEIADILVINYDYFTGRTAFVM